jgi:hypothetical protein
MSAHSSDKTTDTTQMADDSMREPLLGGDDTSSGSEVPTQPLKAPTLFCGREYVGACAILKQEKASSEA